METRIGNRQDRIMGGPDHGNCKITGSGGRCFWVGVAMVVLWGGLLAEVKGGEARKVATVEGITEYQLENGLRCCCSRTIRNQR